MSEKMDFAGGKYTVINDNGKLTALRYGEPWGRDEDLVGDNLVYSMLVDSLQLKAQRDALLEKINGVLAAQRSEGGGCGGFINKPPTREHQRRVFQAWQELHEVIKAWQGEKT